MYLSALPACIYVPCVHSCFPQKSGEGAGTSKTRGMEGCVQLCGRWELNPGPLQEHSMLLTAKLNSSPHLLEVLTAGWHLCSLVV